MTELPPWRRPPRGHFPGVPAWGAPVDRLPEEDFGVAQLGPVTPEWAWGGADGAGVRVCVLDSGVDADHPLVGPLARTLEVAAGPDGEITVAESAAVDAVGHGTACASVIRAVAPAASLSSVRVLTNGTFGAGAALLAGLRWAIDEGFDVINMSLSTTKDKFIPTNCESFADMAYFRRCILVAAAHNMPVQSFPWPFASVISVASHDGARPDDLLLQPVPAGRFLRPRGPGAGRLARRAADPQHGQQLRGPAYRRHLRARS